MIRRDEVYTSFHRKLNYRSANAKDEGKINYKVKFHWFVGMDLYGGKVYNIRGRCIEGVKEKRLTGTRCKSS